MFEFAHGENIGKPGLHFKAFVAVGLAVIHQAKPFGIAFLAEAFKLGFSRFLAADGFINGETDAGIIFPVVFEIGRIADKATFTVEINARTRVVGRRKMQFEFEGAGGIAHRKREKIGRLDLGADLDLSLLRFGGGFVEVAFLRQRAGFGDFFADDLPDLKILIVKRAGKEQTAVAHEAPIIPVFQRNGIPVRYGVFINLSLSKFLYGEIINLNITLAAIRTGEEKTAHPHAKSEI